MGLVTSLGASSRSRRTITFIRQDSQVGERTNSDKSRAEYFMTIDMMFRGICILFVLTFVSAVTAEGYANFTGHKLLAVTAKSEAQIRKLKQLREQVDFWNEPYFPYDKTNIRVPPELLPKVEGFLKTNNIEFYSMTENLQEWIDRERRENEVDFSELTNRTAYQEWFSLSTYHNFQEIMKYLDGMAQRYSSLAQVSTIGTTHEGRPIKGLKIGSSGSYKPAIWIDAGIHAREWVAPATALYIINQLITQYDRDPQIKKLVDTYDWYIYPVANPDGYYYTWTANRMWRKNRSPSRAGTWGRTCYGTDPNRNFQAGFGGASTSGDACSDIYRGPYPFSERESQAIRDGVMSIGRRLKAYFTVHSYTQLWMTPYGYKTGAAPDYGDHIRVLQLAINAVARKYGEWYRYGPISSTIYPAAGSSTDWAYETARVKYSFALELRDRGTYGFLLPRHLIKPTAEETFEGMKVVANEIMKEF